ncbi:MAG: hypothetical protein CMK09_11095 [Ponticaulis sp.]|nr:hypothetical protein [Ponticaulis sp.]
MFRWIFIASWVASLTLFSAAAQIAAPNLEPPVREASDVERAFEQYNRGEIPYEDVLAVLKRQEDLAAEHGLPIERQAREENQFLRDTIQAAATREIRRFNRPQYTSVVLISDSVEFVGDSYKYSADGMIFYINPDGNPEYTQKISSDGTAGEFVTTAWFRSARAVQTAFYNIEDRDHPAQSIRRGPFGHYIYKASVTVDGVLAGQIWLNEEGKPYLIRYYDEHGRQRSELDYTYQVPKSLGDPEGPLSRVSAPAPLDLDDLSETCRVIGTDINDLIARLESVVEQVDGIVAEHERLVREALSSDLPISFRASALRTHHATRLTEMGSLNLMLADRHKDLADCETPGNSVTAPAPSTTPDPLATLAQPQLTPYEIELEMTGVIANGEAPIVEIRLDTTLVERRSVAGQYKTLINALPDQKELSVRFTNDWYRAGLGDRNVENIAASVNDRPLKVIRNSGRHRNNPGPTLANSGTLVFDLESWRNWPDPCPFRPHIDTLRKDGPLECSCTDPTARGAIYGTNIYRSESFICKAALHAGEIGVKGGVVTVYPVNGAPTYAASEQNGISSLGGGGSDDAFTFSEELAN